MVAPITNALLSGYTALQILDFVSQKSKSIKRKIDHAKELGYQAEHILDYITDDNTENQPNLTAFQRLNRKRAQREKKAALKLAGGVALAGTAAAGLYAASVI